LRGNVTSDSLGRYSIDSLPPGHYAVGFESPLLDSLEIALPPRVVTIAAGQTATVDLALPPAATLRAAVCPGVALPPETGAIYGRVVSAETESALDGVVIALSWRVHGAVGTARTDAAGRYSLAQLPAGTQVLEVRRFGYEVSETPVELRSGATTTSDVRLRRVIVRLDSMRVVATRSRYPEFQQRREHRAYGTFLGPEEMARQHVTFSSDIIEKFPAFRIVGTGSMAVVADNRGVVFNGACPTNVVIDGAEHRSINELSPADIGAIEIYPSSPGGIFAPDMYDKGCGAILIWTKR
jgi:hypothetical protein